MPAIRITIILQMLVVSPVVAPHIVLVPMLVITPVVSVVITPSLGLAVLRDSLGAGRCLLKSVTRLIFKLSALIRVGLILIYWLSIPIRTMS